MPSGVGVSANAFGSTNVPTQYQNLVMTSAIRWGVPPALLAAQLNAESGFNPNVVSPAGAEGIAQFMPDTARSNGVDPWNPASAIDGMAKLDARYFKDFGSWDKALAAYHDGPGRIPSGYVSPEGQSYVQKILAAAGGAISGAIITSPVGDTTTPTDSLSNVTHLFGNLLDATWWKRVGVGGLGVTLILLGLFFMATKQQGSMKVLKKVETAL